MLSPNALFDYQKKAVNFQCTRQHSMLWLDMGLGKTAITLTSLAHLLSNGFLRGVVIVAPIRVTRLVWRQEAAKWAHTKHLTFSLVTGTRDQRTRALLRPADIYLINFENLGWLSEVLQTYFVKKNRPLPFNGIVWDEISKMKNSSTQRVKSYRKISEFFDWATGLTGTPASNGYKDLHGQFLVVDRGQRLGTSKTAFKTRFYRKVGPYKEVPYEDTEETVKQLIGDITLEMSAEDYNPLPDLIVNDIEIEMPEELRASYDQLERDFFTVLDSGKEIEVFNSAALTNKCLQFSNGSVYPIAGMPLWEPVHELKLDALEEIVDEAQGSPILCSYAYRSDAQRIMERFKDLNPINLTECKSESALNNAMGRWQAGDCPLMIGHPACLGADTPVLTERDGWVRIIDVRRDDRVFDGVEFVEHGGLSYSGYKDVIDVFGVTMTPNHKILIGDEWVEAKDVEINRKTLNKAIYRWEESDRCPRGMRELRGNADNTSSELRQAQSGETTSLSAMHRRDISSPNGNKDMENLARYEVASAEQSGQELRRSGNRIMRRVARLRAILRRYARRVLGRFNDRASGCEQTVQQGQLYMGDQHGAAVEQADQSVRPVPRREGASRGVVPPIRVHQDDVADETESRDVGGRSGEGLRRVSVPEESETCKREEAGKAHVYDLVNCGPRHRFAIRLPSGDVIISHNSMGHGIDGLQKMGHILVWFGLNWSLDLYEQFNARVRRQGQGAPVMCHRILMKDTLDQAQALAISEKATTQSGLRNAVKQYRMSRGV